MATVKVLIEGYAKPLDKGWKANSTVCLVTVGDKKIITDPGCNHEALLSALKEEGLTANDIDYVFLSHRHPDHVLLAGLFENAKYITFDTNLMYDKDVLLEFDKHVLGEEVEIIDTPGHVNEHLSLIVDTPEGKVAIAGDVIWWIDTEKQVFDLYQKDHNQAIDMDMETLVKSRKKLLKKPITLFLVTERSLKWINRDGEFRTQAPLRSRFASLHSGLLTRYMKYR